MAIEGRRSGQWRWPVGLAAYAVVSLAAIVFAPEWLVNGSFSDRSVSDALDAADRAAAMTAARQTVLLSAGGLLAVFTLFLTQRRDALARERHEIDRDKLEIDRNKHEIDRDSNRTTRYTEAIKQLGDEEHRAIRLGGIYALERIAVDSERDRQTILDVLTSWIRDEAPRPQGGDTPPARSNDTTAAIVVVGRVSQLEGVGDALELSRTDLAFSNLRGANLAGAFLTGSDLTHADLIEASLIEAYLTGASLRDARLNHADARGARLVDTDLTRANLIGVDFTSALFLRADLTDAHLAKANFAGADLREAVGLSETEVAKSYWNATTRWPTGITPPQEARPAPEVRPLPLDSVIHRASIQKPPRLT